MCQKLKILRGLLRQSGLFAGVLVLLMGAPVLGGEDGGGGDGSDAQREKLEEFIGWLLDTDDRVLANVRFADVVKAATGREVRRFDPEDPVDAEVMAGLSEAFDVVFADIRREDHPVHAVGRINEVSGVIEDLVFDAIGRQSGFSSTWPLNARGHVQRSGYPDIRIVHDASGRVYYLDPKVYREGSERSGFRTFYFEPRVETNKILDDAAHLIMGIAHRGRRGEVWEFAEWSLVDLVDFRVRLKAEFQASNREMYAPEGLRLRGGRLGGNSEEGR
ncbi:MAG: hypothetical protein JJT96_05120 [Opitutales bacterium]|nr:hypothetical protein [Opitutales bacterium]